MNAHYVYKITNINPVDSRKYYIGVRTAPSGNPEEDTDYMGSSDYLDEAIREQGLEFFSKEILSTWETRELANLEEVRLHKLHNVVKDNTFYNMAYGNNFDGSCNTGMVSCIDVQSNEKVFITSETYQSNKSRYQYHQTNYYNAIDTTTQKYIKVTIEEYYANENLSSDHKNMVVAVNKETGVKTLVSTEEFRNNDFLVGVAHNRVSVKMPNGETKSISRNEFLSDTTNYRGAMKNMTMVENINTGEVKRFEIGTYDTSLWTTVLTKRARGAKVNTAIKVEIYDANNTLRFLTHGNFAKICEQNKLPKTALSTSYHNSGEPIYTDVDKRMKTILTNKDFYKFKGWYAKKV